MGAIDDAAAAAAAEAEEEEAVHNGGAGARCFCFFLKWRLRSVMVLPRDRLLTSCSRPCSREKRDTRGARDRAEGVSD